MPRESVEEKGVRYLRERRIRVDRIDGDRVQGRARGEGDIYRLVVGGGPSRCTCPARVSRCSHVAALELIAAALPLDLARRTQPTASAVGSKEPSPRGLVDVARPTRERPQPEWETVDGVFVIDACPHCGTVDRVAVIDGLCPRCSRAPSDVTRRLVTR